MDKQTAKSVSQTSIVLASAFAVLGVGLLYLYIAIASVPAETKLLWASGLSIAVAFLFAAIWTMARDVEKQAELESKKR